MPRGISVTYELRNDTGLVDVVVATHRIERVAAVMQPIGVAGSAPGGGVDDDTADWLRASAFVALARHTAPGDRWWRGVHGFSVPQVTIDVLFLQPSSIQDKLATLLLFQQF